MNKAGQFGRGSLSRGWPCPLVVRNACGAKELPTPKVFHDIPAQKGQWRVGIPELDRQGGRKWDAAMPGTMSICMDSFMDIGNSLAQLKGMCAE